MRATRFSPLVLPCGGADRGIPLANCFADVLLCTHCFLLFLGSVVVSDWILVRDCHRAPARRAGPAPWP